MDKQSFLGKLVIALLAICLLVITVVVVFDPFYHYHKPWFGLKAVLNEPEHQVIGTIRNFDYDAIILGSSLAENYDNEWFDNGFNCTTIKGIKKSGTTAYLTYYLDTAYRNHDLKYVFYSLDVSALLADYSLDLKEDGMPVYLYDNNPFNDVNYIFNKDVIFEKIPYMLAQSMSNDYRESESYNWAKYKSFSEEIARSNYDEPERQELSEEMAKKYADNIENNVSAIEFIVNKHPETIYYIWIPPYSSLWRDEMDRLGQTDVVADSIAHAKETLEKYENVRFISFIDDYEITDNLDNYMDPIHYSQEISYYIYSQLLQK